jgi:hypothetical protein
MSDDAPGHALMVFLANADAGKRGALAIWTIYSQPNDHPDGFVARLHEVGRGITGPTEKTIEGGLDEIRHALCLAGLTRLPRHADDEPCIIESWL